MLDPEGAHLVHPPMLPNLAPDDIENRNLVLEPLTARVRDLLLMLPAIGSVKAGRILARCGIAHAKTLAGLTARQRAELINHLHR